MARAIPRSALGNSLRQILARQQGRGRQTTTSNAYLVGAWRGGRGPEQAEGQGAGASHALSPSDRAWAFQLLREHGHDLPKSSLAAAVLKLLGILGLVAGSIAAAAAPPPERPIADVYIGGTR